jgi:hypothetical protein
MREICDNADVTTYMLWHYLPLYLSPADSDTLGLLAALFKAEHTVVTRSLAGTEQPRDSNPSMRGPFGAYIRERARADDWLARSGVPRPAWPTEELVGRATLTSPAQAEYLEFTQVTPLTRRWNGEPLSLKGRQDWALDYLLALPGATRGKSAIIMRRQGRWVARVPVFLPVAPEEIPPPPRPKRPPGMFDD